RGVLLPARRPDHPDHHAARAAAGGRRARGSRCSICGTYRRDRAKDRGLMDVVMPQLGETVTEGTISVWHKRVGDPVRAEEPLFEVETDKVTMDINAPAAGVLAQILVPVGERVGVGARLAVIQLAGELAGEHAAAPGPGGTTARPAAASP